MNAALRGVLAALAIAYLVVMYTQGARPTREQFIAFEAAGIMAESPAQVREVGIEADGRAWLIERRDETWWLAGTQLPAASASQLSLAVKFLHTARPVREVGDDADDADLAYGLGKPALAVRARLADGTQYTLDFGARTPDGSLQYVRAAPPARIYLMSNFVGEEWGALAAALASATDTASQ
jgi:hypothetical protein